MSKRNIVAVMLAALSVAASAAELNLQERLDAAAKAGGGRVVVPAGDWTTGPLTLGSGV